MYIRKLSLHHPVHKGMVLEDSNRRSDWTPRTQEYLSDELALQRTEIQQDGNIRKNLPISKH